MKSPPDVAPPVNATPGLAVPAYEPVSMFQVNVIGALPIKAAKSLADVSDVETATVVGDPIKSVTDTEPSVGAAAAAPLTPVRLSVAVRTVPATVTVSGTDTLAPVMVSLVM